MYEEILKNSENAKKRKNFAKCFVFFSLGVLGIILLLVVGNNAKNISVETFSQRKGFPESKIARAYPEKGSEGTEICLYGIGFEPTDKIYLGQNQCFMRKFSPTALAVVAPRKSSKDPFFCVFRVNDVITGISFEYIQNKNAPVLYSGGKTLRQGNTLKLTGNNLQNIHILVDGKVFQGNFQVNKEGTQVLVETGPNFFKKGENIVTVQKNDGGSFDSMRIQIEESLEKQLEKLCNIPGGYFDTSRITVFYGPECPSAEFLQELGVSHRVDMGDLSEYVYANNNLKKMVEKFSNQIRYAQTHSKIFITAKNKQDAYFQMICFEMALRKQFQTDPMSMWTYSPDVTLSLDQIRCLQFFIEKRNGESVSGLKTKNKHIEVDRAALGVSPCDPIKNIYYGVKVSPQPNDFVSKGGTVCVCMSGEASEKFDSQDVFYISGSESLASQIKNIFQGMRTPEFSGAQSTLYVSVKKHEDLDLVSYFVCAYYMIFSQQSAFDKKKFQRALRGAPDISPVVERLLMQLQEKKSVESFWFSREDRFDIKNIYPGLTAS